MKISTIAGCCVMTAALALAQASCIWTPPEPDSFLHGRELEKAGRYLEARDYYENMRNPAARDAALHNLRHLYGDILTAMQTSQDDPQSADAYYALARAYYDKMLSIPVESAELMLNLNFATVEYAAAHRQQFQQWAQPAIETAVHLQPAQPDALVLQAKVYEAGNQPERAMAVYRDMIAAQQANAETYYRLAALTFNHGDRAQALDYAREATVRFPDDADSYLMLGRVCAMEEMRAEAIAAFEQGLCLNPFQADGYYRLAHVYLADGNLVDAERVVRLGALQTPEADNVILLLASLEAIMNEKQMTEFMAIYDTVIYDVAAILSSPTATTRDAAPSPALEIQYLRLMIRYLERQRPYTFLCSEEEPHPYFDYQIRLYQSKILEKEALLAEMEAAEAAAETEAAAEDETAGPADVADPAAE
jgi:tetratricopeptide (TPR) repeat protein